MKHFQDPKNPLSHETVKARERPSFPVKQLLKSGFLFNKTYQCNVILPFKSWLTAEHCEIYEYQHYNQIAKNTDTDCPFCAPEAERTLLAETATAYAILDNNPVTHGHTLIIPKRHVANYFDLTTREQTACWLMVNFVKQILSELYQTNDFNIGINVGEAAGQVVAHGCIGVIPRRLGDVVDAVGGVRNVIKGRGRY